MPKISKIAIFGGTNAPARNTSSAVESKKVVEKKPPGALWGPGEAGGAKNQKNKNIKITQFPKCLKIAKT